MSSSCLRRSIRSAILDATALAVMAALPVASARAADVTFQPSVELRAESSSNQGLNPVTTAASDSYGGVADFAAFMRINTPRGETWIRPKIKLQEYSERNHEPVEAFLDLRSHYNSLRSELDLWAGYDRRDTYTAEFPNAVIDDNNPGDPTTPETGNSQIGLTRDRVEVRPTYTYKVNERTSVGAEVLYQTVRYSEEAAQDRVNYDFAKADGFVRWAIDSRSNIKAGGYVSRYDAKNEVNQTDAYGGTVAFERQWSETAGTTVEVIFERNDVINEPEMIDESTSGWGAVATSYWQGEVSEWQFSAGKTFTPTGRGGKSTAYQARVQYDRDLSARWQFRGAVRVLRDESINQIGENGNRDYGRLESSLRWKMAPTWFVEGGYSYTYQDRVSDPEAADDNKFFIGVGYLGLGPQRR